jgi:FAD/FMN-containing dehydrogenase
MNPESWGRNPKVYHRNVVSMEWRNQELNVNTETNNEFNNTALPFGLGRSYGDCCLNENGILVKTSFLNKIISFDAITGIIKVEAGISLLELLTFIVPRGWFLPVTPGTKFVTVGGAIANDIHGKNQTKDGSFGCYVNGFEILRSDNSRYYCSKSQNSNLFSATIAGLGLTGLITWAEINLKKINSPLIDQETIPFVGLDTFAKIADESEQDYLYTVAWIDCMSKNDNFGRGIFFRGNHSQLPAPTKVETKKVLFNIPMNFPNFSLNNLTLSLFNESYYRLNSYRKGKNTVHYDPFFYPLDSVGSWNKVYGQRGFFQFQCVVPTIESIHKILRTITDSGEPSFLGVIKKFGDLISPGMLSFPRKGITLALDFPNKGVVTKRLIKSLHDIVRKYGENSAIYPAKDSWMTQEEFKLYFPKWDEFSDFIDPNFSSSLWRRVMA